MKKKYFQYIIIIITISGLLFNFNKKINFYDGFRKPSESPDARKIWDSQRLTDPSTGKLPNNIHSKEIAFTQTLPNDIGSNMLNWIKEGPFNVGGRTRALAIDITDENILLAGGASGGIWRSTDQGQSWDKMTRHFQLHNVTCIEQDQRSGKENIWYHGNRRIIRIICWWG